MRKTDKKIDNQLRKALTQVCDSALEQIEGFVWLTHRADYGNFPKSLKIVCVFALEQHKADFTANNGHHALNKLIVDKLTGLGLTLSNMDSKISFDSEERCEREHQGNWARRLA